MKPNRYDYPSVAKAMIPCPICAGTTFQTLCTTDRYLMGVTTARCQSCGLIMTNPMPTEQVLSDFYANYYRQHYRKLAKPDESYIWRYKLDQRATYTVDYLLEHKLLFPGVQVLDVGCGEGSILREIRQRVPQARVRGVEVSRPFAQFARDYIGEVVYHELDDVPRTPDRLYDLILLSHVLEHIHDPTSFIKLLSTYLKPQGKLFLDVPDVCRYHWLADLHIAHIYHFSPWTLAGAVSAGGLIPLHLDTHHPPRLPWCARVICGRQGSPAKLPDDRTLEDQAALRISQMHRHAWLFARCFNVVMTSFEYSWTYVGQLRGKHKPSAPLGLGPSWPEVG